MSEEGRGRSLPEAVPLMLQWSLASMSEEGGRGMHITFPTPKLQWSLASMSEEGHPATGRRSPDPCASMEPRFNERGRARTPCRP